MDLCTDVVVVSDVNHGVRKRIWPYGEMWGNAKRARLSAFLCRGAELGRNRDPSLFVGQTVGAWFLGGWFDLRSAGGC